MNRGKFEVVKQEMARVNIDILGISELKWTGMGEFNLVEHYIYYCGQESLTRNGVFPQVLGCCVFIFIRFYAYLDFFFHFFCDLLVIQKCVV